MDITKLATQVMEVLLVVALRGKYATVGRAGAWTVLARTAITKVAEATIAAGASLRDLKPAARREAAEGAVADMYVCVCACVCACGIHVFYLGRGRERRGHGWKCLLSPIPPRCFPLLFTVPRFVFRLLSVVALKLASHVSSMPGDAVEFLADIIAPLHGSLDSLSR